METRNIELISGHDVYFYICIHYLFIYCKSVCFLNNLYRVTISVVFVICLYCMINVAFSFYKIQTFCGQHLEQLNSRFKAVFFLGGGADEAAMYNEGLSVSFYFPCCLQTPRFQFLLLLLQDSSFSSMVIAATIISELFSSTKVYLLVSFRFLFQTSLKPDGERCQFHRTAIHFNVYDPSIEDDLDREDTCFRKRLTPAYQCQ